MIVVGEYIRVSMAMGVPEKIDGLYVFFFSWKAHLEMDDLEVPPFQETPILLIIEYSQDIQTSESYPLVNLHSY